MLSFLESWRKKKSPPPISLSWDDSALVVTPPGRATPSVILWSDIDQIATFKRVLWTIDNIRVALHDSHGWHEIGEEDMGFMDFVAAMQLRYPSIPTKWYLEVMFPPFAPNSRVLWQRQRTT